MRLIDAHLHLADPGLKSSVEDFVREAKAIDVGALVSAGMNTFDSERNIALARQFGPVVRAAVGIHPWTVVQTPKIETEPFERLVQRERGALAAIGEIGLDGQYTTEAAVVAEQRRVFRKMLAVAGENSLPVVVHSRLAINLVLDDLRETDARGVLLHWYSGPTDLLREIRDRGYVISVGPSVAYSKRSVEIAKAAGLEMLLTETDAPVEYYGPFKGRATSPAFIPEVVHSLARIENLPEQDVAEQVRRNFERLFDLRL